MKPFDPSKPVRTRSGRAARIIATDLANRAGASRIAAAVMQDAGFESTLVVHSDGRVHRFGDTSFEDLVNVPEKHVRWASIYMWQGGMSVWLNRTREDADENAKDGRIACIRIEFEEGEGL